MMIQVKTMWSYMRLQAARVISATSSCSSVGCFSENHHQLQMSIISWHLLLTLDTQPICTQHHRPTTHQRHSQFSRLDVSSFSTLSTIKSEQTASKFCQWITPSCNSAVKIIQKQITSPAVAEKQPIILTYLQFQTEVCFWCLFWKLMHDFRASIPRRSFWALRVGVVVDSCKIVSLWGTSKEIIKNLLGFNVFGHFLFTCSDTFAVGCIV